MKCTNCNEPSLFHVGYKGEAKCRKCGAIIKIADLKPENAGRKPARPAPEKRVFKLDTMKYFEIADEMLSVKGGAKDGN